MGVGVEKVEEMVPREPTRHLIARWVSIIVHPVVLPLVTLFVIVDTATHSLKDAGRWVLLAVLLTSLPVASLVGFQVLRGRWSDLDVSIRKQRYALYPFGLACMIALLIVFVRFGAPRVAVRAAAGLAFSNVAGAFINFVYKVSAHAAGAAICATLLLLAAAPAWGVSAIGATVLVGWSRVELGRHTVGQVVLGWAVGVGCALAAFALV